MSRIPRIRILLLLFALYASPVGAGSLTLTWDPNTEPDVVGYTVFYGTQSGVYTFSRAVGNVTSWTADNLAPGQTYYFAVQAVAASGLTSPLSAEVSGVVPAGVPVCTGVTATVPATGTVGASVPFLAQPIPLGCTGTVAYQWTFGDGSSGASGTASHAYSAARTYTWSLSATVNGTAMAPQSGAIAVSAPVIENLCRSVTAAVPATGTVGAPVTFAAQSSPAGCTGAVAYRWTFGDGASSTSASASHAYSAAKAYTWTLSATVNGTAVASQTGAVAISAPPSENLCKSLTAVVPNVATAGTPVTFAAQAGPIGCTGAVAYQWAFGDGASSTQATSSHTYDAERNYSWTLAATVNGVALAPQAGTIAVSSDACAPRQVLAAPPPQPGVHQARTMWQDMGVTVEAGDALRITAYGTWRNGNQAWTSAGDPNQLLDGSNCPLAGAPLLALVARIGVDGAPFLVGNGEAVPIDRSGTLYLAPNDNWYTLWDNAGSLDVMICAGPPEPVACTGISATVPASAAVGVPVTLIAQPSPAGCTGDVSYDWTFGDGASSTQGTVPHTYSVAQRYAWTLEATVDGAAVAPQSGTIAVSNDICTSRTIMAAPPQRPGVHLSQAMWQDMGVTVRAGDAVRITVSGTWQSGSRALTASGDDSQVLAGSNCPLPGAPQMALVARIGATGTPFAIRSGEAVTVPEAGSLYLAPNDNWYMLWDNAGSLGATICVGAPVPVPCTGVTATVPATAGAGSPVTFSARPIPSGCIGDVAYDWTFGDGLASSQATASHTYYAADLHTWTLTATVGGVAVPPQTGTVSVSTEACTTRTVVAVPPGRQGADPVQAMWQSTGVTVEAGSVVRITAAGAWRNGNQSLTAAGDASQTVDFSNCPLPGAPLMALVARIGTAGTPFLVRSGEALPAPAAGTLYLAPNDNWYMLWDNAGSLAVTICSRQ